MIGGVVEIDFSEILIERVEEDLQEEKKKVVEHLEELKSLLIRIAEARRWTLTTTAMGMETHHPEQERHLDLLERCGLIESKVKYTRHNEYREYSVTEKGQALVRQFLSDV